eukprot:7865476-Pyramimonas_sp.AAC.1
MACRGICTTSRFHCIPRGCIFDCEAPSGVDYDDLNHYSVCPRLRALCVSHLGPFHAPGDDEWFSELILTSSLTLSPSAMLRYASCCDAFVHAHSTVRTGSSAVVEQ